MTPRTPVADRAPTCIWPLSRHEDSGYVRTFVDDRVLIYMPEVPDDSMSGGTAIVTRKEARLLAKRINECLDWTAKS